MSATTPSPLQFDDFVLDEANARLLRAGEALDVPPKAFAVLCVLARHAGQLVLKEALLDAVWGHQHVSESVLKNLVSQLRGLLGDDARQPRYIETAARRGYRFVATLREASQVSAAMAHVPRSSIAVDAAAGAQSLIGRARALQTLQRALDATHQGRRTLMLVAGEPGIGKTTLIERFVGQQPQEVVASAVGLCVEHYGVGEPYMPVLEAVNTWCRGAHGAELVGLMRQVAPTWLAQLPWHLTDGDRQQLQREVAGATQDRMLREFGELMDRFAQLRAVLLVLEDLHWSDSATVQLIGYLARRRGSARFMLLGSFRPTEIIVSDHPLKGQRQELRLHGLCEELDLEAFSETELAEYLARRFDGWQCPEDSVRALHAHTEGLPLFVTSVIDELMAQDLIRRTAEGAWEIGVRRLSVPQNVAGVIEKQAARLPEQTQNWLAAASVAGQEFLDLALADAIGIEPQLLQDAFDALARRQQWLRSLSAQTLPDGRVAARYAFGHALYRHVFYQGLGRAQRMQWHLRVAAALQRVHGVGAAEDMAAELAMHFERGGAAAQAVGHLRVAAAKALARSSAPEAQVAVRRALRLLAELPQDEDSLAAELDLRIIEGAALTHSAAYAAPEVARAFERAQFLCDQLPEQPARARAMHGLYWVSFAGGDLARALQLARRMVGLAELHADASLQLAGHGAMGLALAHAGNFPDALAHLAQGWQAYEQAGVALRPGAFLQDPGVEILSYQSLVQWWTGDAREAHAGMARCLALAESTKHPLTQAVALHFAGVLHALEGDADGALRTTSRILGLTAHYGIWKGPGGHTWIQGWAMTASGRVEEGLARMREAQAYCRRAGMLGGLTGFYFSYADACRLAGLHAESAAAAREGLEFADARGEHCLSPALHRLLGQALFALGDTEGAACAFEQAVARATRQRADHQAIEALTAWTQMERPPDKHARNALAALVAAHAEAPSPQIAMARQVLGIA